jgi:hypothetical protein
MLKVIRLAADAKQGPWQRSRDLLTKTGIRVQSRLSNAPFKFDGFIVNFVVRYAVPAFHVENFPPQRGLLDGPFMPNLTRTATARHRGREQGLSIHVSV